ncbi:MAG: hypothetical protein ACK56F_25430, partial [bacterium]
MRGARCPACLPPLTGVPRRRSKCDPLLADVGALIMALPLVALHSGTTRLSRLSMAPPPAWVAETGSALH